MTRSHETDPRCFQTNAFCGISDVPISQSRLKVQPVYRICSPRLFEGNFVTNAVCKWLHVSSDSANHDVICVNSHNQFYLAVHNHAKTTRIRLTLLHTARYQSLPILRSTGIRSLFGHTVICLGERYFLMCRHTHRTVSCISQRRISREQTLV